MHHFAFNPGDTAFKKKFNREAQNIVQFEGDFILYLYSALQQVKDVDKQRLCSEWGASVKQEIKHGFYTNNAENSRLNGRNSVNQQTDSSFPTSPREGKERIIQNEEIIYTSY